MAIYNAYVFSSQAPFLSNDILFYPFTETQYVSPSDKTLNPTFGSWSGEVPGKGTLSYAGETLLGIDSKSTHRWATGAAIYTMDTSGFPSSVTFGGDDYAHVGFVKYRVTYAKQHETTIDLTLSDGTFYNASTTTVQFGINQYAVSEYWFSALYVRKSNITLVNNNGNPDSYTVGLVGFPMVSVAPPTRNGYTFGGYFSSQGGTGTQYYNADGTSAVTYSDASVTTLYAKWTAKKYYLRIDPNGGTYNGSSSPQTLQTQLEWGSSANSVLAPSVRQGYNFLGYYNVSTDGLQGWDSRGYAVQGVFWTANYANGGVWQYDQATGAFVAYAVWELITRTITFSRNGGEWAGGYTAPSLYAPGSPVTLPTSSEITRTGYTFGGWYDNASFEGGAYTEVGATDVGNKTFYAKWTPITYYIAFNGNDTNVVGSMSTITVQYGESIALPNLSYQVPSRRESHGAVSNQDGKKFLGWNTAADGRGTSYANMAVVGNLTTSSGATVTLYAQWDDVYIGYLGSILSLSGRYVSGDANFCYCPWFDSSFPWYYAVPGIGPSWQGQDPHARTLYWSIDGTDFSGVLSLPAATTFLGFDWPEINLLAIPDSVEENGVEYRFLCLAEFIRDGSAIVASACYTKTDNPVLVWPPPNPSYSTIYIPVYARARYTLTFDLDGGGTRPDQQVSSSVWTSIAAPSRQGAVFVGWQVSGYDATTARYRLSESGEGIPLAGSTATIEATASDTVQVSGLNLGDSVVTMKALWIVPKYTITVSTSTGGGGAVSGSGEYDGGSVITITATPNTGYSFSSWNDGNTNASRSITVLGNASYVATFAAKTFTVTLDGNYTGAPTPETKTVSYNSTYGTLTPPDRTGWAFVGWNTAYDGSGETILPSSQVTITADQTLYAQWQIGVYTVSFNVNGGNSLPVAEASREVEYNTTYGDSSHPFPTPTRTGFEFGGWFTAATGGDEVEASDTFTRGADQTLYAHWSGLEFTVTLNAGDGSGGTASVTATYGSPMPTITAPTLAGKTFGGYFTEEGGEGTRYYNSDASSARTWNIAAATTLYAYWPNALYTVTLDRQGGTGGATSVANVADGTTMPEGVAMPTKVGNTFGGYYTGTEGTGTQYYNADGTPTSATVTSAMTLYAKWTPNTYSVSFVLTDGGSWAEGEPQLTSYTYGVGAALPASEALVPNTEAGVVSFSGWTATPGGTGFVTAISATDVGNKTFYAVWDAGIYTITLSPGSQGIGIEQTVQKEKDASVALPDAIFTRAGYTQTGWSYSDGGPRDYGLAAVYTANQNATLYPVWSSGSLEATFYTTETNPYTAFATTDASSEVDIPAPPAVAGKRLRRYAPTVGATRNNVISLSAQIGAAIGSADLLVLNRLLTDARSLDADGAYIDRWGYGSSDTTIEVEFKEYESCTIAVTIASGNDAGTYEGEVLVREGVSDIIYLAETSTPAKTLRLVLNTDFAIYGENNLEYFAFYEPVQSLLHTVEFWHYDATGAKVVDYTTQVEEGASISDRTISVNTPSIGEGGSWFGAWVPAFGSAEIAVNSDLSFEYVFSLEEFPVDWTGGEGGVSSATLLWGHPYPFLTPLAAKDGYALDGLVLVPVNDSAAAAPSHAANGEPMARCTSTGVLGNPGNYNFSAVWTDASLKVRDIAELRAKAGVVPVPFASVASATVRFPKGSAPTRSAQVSSASSLPTFLAGFGPAFSAPFPSSGAAVVTRKMVNEIGSLGTQNQFFEQCGGYRTYDPEVVKAAGAYPQGALLKYWDASANALRTVRALKSTSADFRPSGPDGVNWAYADDNPTLAVSVDYSDFTDLSDTLFVETGVADLYEVPYDSYLQLFAIGVLDCDSMRRPDTEDVKVAVGYDGEKTAANKVYAEINGMFFTNGEGVSYLDIYNKETGAFGSVPIGGFRPFLWSVCSAYYGYVHFEKICPLSPFSCGVFLSRGDKIRIRNSVVDIRPESLSVAAVVHDRVFTDETLRRIYPVRSAQLYRRGLVQ